MEVIFQLKKIVTEEKGGRGNLRKVKEEGKGNLDMEVNISIVGLIVMMRVKVYRHHRIVRRIVTTIIMKSVDVVKRMLVV